MGKEGKERTVGYSEMVGLNGRFAQVWKTTASGH